MKDNSKKEKRLTLEWGIAIIVAVVMLLTFSYIDLQSLTIWSTNLWDVIAKGDITQYFAYTSENIYHAPHQYVSGTLYSLIPWAIWNLPIWIMQYFFNMPILETPILLIWSTLFLVVCLIGVIWLVKKVTFEITKEKSSSSLAAFLTFSSIWVYIGVFYAGQNDIMICLLALTSIYTLIKKKTKLFLLTASFAISIKYFFFFPFVALVLLTEKNIYKIIGKILIALIPTLIFQIICRGLPMFYVANEAGPLMQMFNELFSAGIPGFGRSNISLFVTGMLCVYIGSYITVPKEEEYNKFIIYTASIGWVPLLLFTQIQFYRPVVIIPFLIILIIQNRKWLKLNLILEIAMEVGMLIVLTLRSKYIFAPSKAAFGLIPNLLKLNIEEVSLGKKIFENFPEIDSMLPAFSTLAVVAMITLVIMNHPRFKEKYIDLKEEKFERWLLWIRPVTILVCVAMMYYTIR